MQVAHNRAAHLQWRVVWLSLLAAALLGVLLIAFPRRHPLALDAALAGLMIGCAGVQLLYALRYERIAGIQRHHAVWRALAAGLFLLSAGLVTLGCLTLLHLAPAT
jgi:hypothetical protein